MRFRFLFVDDRGEEVYVSSTEDLHRYVRSGSLREGALLYDSLTREWAPARTHPAFARFEGGGQESGEAPVEAVGEGTSRSGPEAPVGPGEGEPDLGPPLADEPPDAPLEASLPALEAVPEEEVEIDTVQLFLKEQERERWEDLRDQGEALDTTSLLDGDHPAEAQRHAPISGSWGDTPPEPGGPGFESFLNAQRQWGRSQPPRGWAQEGPHVSRPDPAPEDSGRGDALPLTGSSSTTLPAELPANPSGATRSSSALARWLRRTRARNEHRSRNAGGRQLALLSVLIVVGGWAAADAWGVSPLEAVGIVDEEVLSISYVPVPLTPSMEVAEAEAFHDMVAGMEQLRRTLRVGEPPGVWMGGPYLSNALGFPEVEEYWLRYLEYVETLRDREEDLFRSGFVTRLRLQGVSGPALSIRLARALQDFEADGDRREATYGDMEELARSALGLHDFLVSSADRIRYAPVEHGVDDDPILEAVADDEALQAELWARIERLVHALDGVADADPLSRRDVSRSVLGSLVLPEEDDPSR